MQIIGITLHNGSNESHKRKEQKLIFKFLMPLMSTFWSNYNFYSSVLTNSLLTNYILYSSMTYKYPSFSWTFQMHWQRANAQNVSCTSVYGNDRGYYKVARTYEVYLQVEKIFHEWALRTFKNSFLYVFRFLKIFEKSSEIFGSVQKMFGNFRKISEVL